MLTDHLIWRKAKRIGATMNLPTNFAYSRSWLNRLKAINGQRKGVLHGEAGECNMVGVVHARSELPKILCNYLLRNTYNLDESALFFSKIPTQTLLSSMREGIKGYAKVRVTFNTIGNAPGDYLSLQVVKKA